MATIEKDSFIKASETISAWDRLIPSEADPKRFNENYYKINDLENEIYQLTSELNGTQVLKIIYQIEDLLESRLKLLRYETIEIIVFEPQDRTAGLLFNPSSNTPYFQYHLTLISSIPHPLALEFLCKQYISHPNQFIQMEALRASNNCIAGVLKTSNGKVNAMNSVALSQYHEYLFQALYNSQSPYVQEQARRIIHMNVNSTNQGFPNTNTQNLLWHYGVDQMIKFIGDKRFNLKLRSSILSSLTTCIEKLGFKLNDLQFEQLMSSMESLTDIEGLNDLYVIEDCILALDKSNLLCGEIKEKIIDFLVKNIIQRAEQNEDYRTREYIAKILNALRKADSDQKRKILIAIEKLATTITQYESSEETLCKAIVDLFDEDDFIYFTPDDLIKYIHSLKKFDEKEQTTKSHYDKLVLAAGYRRRLDLRKPLQPASYGIRKLEAWLTMRPPTGATSAEARKNKAHKKSLKLAFQNAGVKINVDVEG